MSSPDEFYRLDYGEVMSGFAEKKLDNCQCGHDWVEHDNDYPYACWHGHSIEATDPCQCEQWNRAIADIPESRHSLTAKAESSRQNGKLGGRPKQTKETK